MAVSDSSLPFMRSGVRSLPQMDDRQFEQWVRLLDERTGMSIPAARKSFLVTNVGLRMRELGYEDFDTYFAHLTSGVIGQLEWTALVDRLTVHETRFFRDPGALKLLSDHVLPELMLRPDWDGDLNIWSVGCSTGEEVYTLAMVLHDFISRHCSEARFGVTGTDISLQSLATARLGVYSDRQARYIPEAFRGAYCQPDTQGRFGLIPTLRRRIAFAQMNVLEVGAASPRRMDVIYCQNLLIYFVRKRRVEILSGLIRHLRPGGSLILGAGEMMNWSNPAIERIPNDKGVLAYRRRH